MEDNKKQTWKDMFVFYDKECKGVIATKKLEKYLSAVGVIVSKNELEIVLSKVNEEISFNNIWNEFKDKKVVTDEEIFQAFKEFDQNGVINVNDFKYILMSLGDKLSEDEANKLISYLNKDDKGNIDYVAFMRQYKV